MIRIIILAISISFLLPSCKSYFSVNKTDTQFYKIDKRLDSIKSSKVDSIIAPYKAKLDSKMNEVIGYAEYMNKQRPESTLGNWVADVVAEKAAEISGQKIDFAVQNYGGLRIPEVTKGPVTLGKIYELMPFQNFVTIVTANGNVTKQFFDRMAQYGGWPISKGVKYKIKDGKPVDITINGKPFDTYSTYTIALPDYIANGGDKCFFFKDQKKNITAKLIRDVLIEAVKEANAKGKPISSKIEGRVIKM